MHLYNYVTHIARPGALSYSHLYNYVTHIARPGALSYRHYYILIIIVTIIALERGKRRTGKISEVNVASRNTTSLLTE